MPAFVASHNHKDSHNDNMQTFTNNANYNLNPKLEELGLFFKHIAF